MIDQLQHVLSESGTVAIFAHPTVLTPTFLMGRKVDALLKRRMKATGN